jgi:hypothetical protein
MSPIAQSNSFLRLVCFAGGGGEHQTPPNTPVKPSVGFAACGLPPIRWTDKQIREMFYDKEGDHAQGRYSEDFQLSLRS